MARPLLLILVAGLLTLQGFDKYGIGAHSAVPTPNLQRELGLKAGVVTSGNSLDYTTEDMALMVENGAAVKVGAEQSWVM